jgi:hypothetical protein
MRRWNHPSPLLRGETSQSKVGLMVCFNALGLTGQRLSPDEIKGVDPFSELS